MMVTFEASSAENPNATITQYEWTVNDPNNFTHVIGTSPTLSHAFATSGTYVVTLNVTNSEGLWSLTENSVVVLPDFGPTADFNLTPLKPWANRTETFFDASFSQVGWSSSIAGYASIVNYTWNFGDGTPVYTTGDSQIQHVFAVAGNYSVTLTITDSVSRTSIVSQLIQVVNRPPWDISGDGITDMRDLAIVVRAFGTYGPNYLYPGSPASPNWNPAADAGDFGVVDMRDVALVASHFGQPD
jgi:PKD repeat protein